MSNQIPEIFYREKVQEICRNARCQVREGMFFAVYDGNRCLSGKYLHTKSKTAWIAAYEQVMQDVLDDLVKDPNEKRDEDDWKRWRGPVLPSRG